MIKEKITEKEILIRELIGELKSNLNRRSLIFKENPNDWSYLTSLSHTEMKIKEILEFLDTLPKAN